MPYLLSFILIHGSYYRKRQFQGVGIDGKFYTVFQGTSISHIFWIPLFPNSVTWLLQNDVNEVKNVEKKDIEILFPSLKLQSTYWYDYSLLIIIIVLLVFGCSFVSYQNYVNPKPNYESFFDTPVANIIYEFKYNKEQVLIEFKDPKLNLDKFYDIVKNSRLVDLKLYKNDIANPEIKEKFDDYIAAFSLFPDIDIFFSANKTDLIAANIIDIITLYKRLTTSFQYALDNNYLNVVTTFNSFKFKIALSQDKKIIEKIIFQKI